MARRTRPHQERVLACLQLIEPEAVLEPELAIPQANRSIDGVMRIREASECWGVLRASVSQRTVLIEHWSSPPSLSDLTTAHFKRAAVVEQWSLEKEGWPDRVPLLLIISNGQPRKALSGVKHLMGSSTRGLWVSPECTLGQTLLLDVKGLERRDGTSVLKLLRTPSDSGEILSNLEHLHRDTMLSTGVRDELLEVMMSQSPFTTTEQRLTLKSLRDQARTEGIAEGHADGRDALLEMARRLLGERAADELARIETLDALKEALFERLSPSQP